MRALRVRRSPARFGMARLASGFNTATAVRLGPLEMVSIDPPDLPGPGWHRVRPRLTGICGSDLSTVEGHASAYFDDWVSFPFVPGHEIVGDVAGGERSGQRVVIEPVLGHAARGCPLPFEGAAPGDGDDYAHLAMPPLEPGIQIGFCESTGGGWATELIAHDSQLHVLPDSVTDEQGVLVEPTAGGIHAALMCAPLIAGVAAPVVAVLGAGTMGLCAVAGLRRYLPDDTTIVVGARYPVQQRLARDLGADTVVDPDELPRAVRRIVGCHMVGDHLTGGAHATIDAVGSAASIGACLRITRPRGRVVLLGMPAEVTLDLTGLWHRETQLVGAYTYGTETMPDGSRTKTFDLAIDTVVACRMERLLSATYRLDDHADAIRHAAEAGRRGAVKVAFDLRPATHSTPPSEIKDH